MSDEPLAHKAEDGGSPWWLPQVEDPPSAETLDWVARRFGPNARVTGARRLTGGLVSGVHLVTVRDGQGRDREAVLRTFSRPDRERSARMVRDEARILQALSSSGLPAPVLIDADAEGGDNGGVASLLMTRLPGEIDLDPEHPDAWLEQMARTLARIHNTRLERFPGAEAGHPRRTRAGAWIRTPELWQRAWDVMDEPAPAFSPCLIHGDYQHFNQLWLDGVLTGVVDWGSATTGCPDSDVGHCRLNLAVLFSADWAERFRLAYEAEAGRRVDPWWDLAELLEYSPEWQAFIPIQVAGRVPVDVEGMTERVEELIGLTLAKL